MEKTSQIIDKISERIGRIIAWMMLAMVLLMFASVVQRYVFQNNPIWQQEMIQYLHAILFMLAAGYTMKHNRHVRVDILYEKFSYKSRAIVDILGIIFLVLTVCGAVIYFSWDFVISSWEVMEGSREYGGLEAVYILKSNIILFAALVILQSVSEIFKGFRVFYNKKCHTLP